MSLPARITKLVPRQTAFFVCDIQERLMFGPTVPEVLSTFTALSDELKYGPFAKSKFGMLTPEVEALIEEKEIQSVVLFGVESHICVLQTALALLGSKRDVFVLADGISSINAGEVPIAIARMRDAGAHITTSESFLYELMGDASDAKFKTFAGIMKEEKDKIAEGVQALLGNARASL